MSYYCITHLLAYTSSLPVIFIDLTEDDIHIYNAIMEAHQCVEDGCTKRINRACTKKRCRMHCRMTDGRCAVDDHCVDPKVPGVGAGKGKGKAVALPQVAPTASGHQAIPPADNSLPNRFISPPERPPTSMTAASEPIPRTSSAQSSRPRKSMVVSHSSPAIMSHTTPSYRAPAAGGSSTSRHLWQGPHPPSHGHTVPAQSAQTPWLIRGTPVISHPHSQRSIAVRRRRRLVLMPRALLPRPPTSGQGSALCFWYG